MIIKISSVSTNEVVTNAEKVVICINRQDRKRKTIG